MLGGFVFLGVLEWLFYIFLNHLDQRNHRIHNKHSHIILLIIEQQLQNDHQLILRCLRNQCNELLLN